MRAALFLLSLILAMAPARRAEALLCTPILGCSCTVNATDMAFGQINVISGGPATAENDVQVTCSGVIDVAPLVSAKINGGLHGSIADRQMKSGANVLHYNLYTTNGYGTIAGDGVTYPMLVVSGGLIALGTWSVTAHLYGRIPATPSALPGNYSDTVTVRIDW